MAQKQQPLPAHNVDGSDVFSDSDESNKEKLAHKGAASDPDFEDKVELKYEDCPEKTGFTYPS